MSISVNEYTRIGPAGVVYPTDVQAERIEFDDTYLHCYLKDGRVISVPWRWFPRLRNATPEQRARWELVGPGIGIHWPDLDEDLSVRGFLSAGQSG